MTQAAGTRHHRDSVPAGRAGPVVLAPPFARAGPRKFLSDRHTRSPPLCHPEPESGPDEGRRGAAGKRLSTKPGLGSTDPSVHRREPEQRRFGAGAGRPESVVRALSAKSSMETGMNYIAPRAEPLIREIPLSRFVLAPENVPKTPPNPRADAELSGAATNAGRPWPARNAVRRQSPPSGLCRGGAGRWPSRPLGPSPPARRCPVEVMAAHGVARFARRLQSAVFPRVQGTCSCLFCQTGPFRMQVTG